MDFEQVLNDTTNHKLDLVQGFPGISNKTVWVTADSVPPNVEVVTRYPLSEAHELRALVDCIRGKSSISFGLIVPEDSFMKPQMLSLEDGEHLRGELCAWNSSSMRIYRKPFDSSIACGKAKEIVFHTCLLTEGSVLSVFRNLKKETVHLTINGIEQKVSVGGCCPNFCYGYLRLSANGAGSKIRVTLVPRENEAYFKQLPSAKAARGCLRFFIGLGRVLLEVLGLGSLFSSVPANGNQVQEEVAEEPEPTTGPDAEHDPGSEPEGEASDPELE